MDSRARSGSTPLTGLLQLQEALDNLQEMADAYHRWSNDPDTSIIDHWSAPGPDNSSRRELLEAFAELLKDQYSRRYPTDFLNPYPALTEFSPEISSGLREGPCPRSGPRFEVIRPHAEGGLGTVSVAIDRELNREVAFKQIHVRQADNPARRDRFLIEAEITGGLEHPGIVPVYSLGHSSDGRPYYAMKLIRGETLADAIERFHDRSPARDSRAWSFELRKLLRRFMDVCNAVDYAHGRGILHRDLKPSNIMIGKHGETLVVDWGLAKPIGATETDRDDEGPLLISPESGETLPGSTVGTPAFMSPEQAARDRPPLEPTSDVYSLGATFFCLLTGRSPFVSKEPGRILEDVRAGNFPRPREIKPSLPRPLEAICLKAMALKPTDRYASTRELADEIERWMADEPVVAFREPIGPRVGRWARQHRTMVAAVLAGLLVATISLGLVLAVQSRANDKLREANALANRINHSLVEANAREARSNQELQAASLRERARFDLALDALRTFHNGVSDDPLLREAEFAGLRSRLLQGAIAFYRRLEFQLAEQHDRTSREATARVYSQIAHLEARYGTRQEILSAYRKALELRRALAEESPQDPKAKAEVASCLISLGVMVRSLEGASASLHLLEEARSILEVVGHLAPANRWFQGLLAQAEMEHGESLKLLKRNQLALEAFDRALKIQEKLAQEDPGSLGPRDALATLLNRRGVLQIFMNRHRDAQETLKQARAILEQLIQSDPANSRFQLELSGVLKDLGDLMSWSGRIDESLKLHERALAIRESLSATLPTSAAYRVLISHSLLATGQIHVLKGNQSFAVEAFRRSAALQEGQGLSSVGLYNLALTRADLAQCLTGAERATEADRAAMTFRHAIQLGHRDFAAIRSVAKSRSCLGESAEFRLLILDLDFPESPFDTSPATDRAILTHR